MRDMVKDNFIDILLLVIKIKYCYITYVCNEFINYICLLAINITAPLLKLSTQLSNLHRDNKKDT